MSVKSKLMQMAREQFAESDANLDQEQIDAGLNDAAVTAEVNAEVVAPLGEIDQGLADVEASVADADALAANADRLEQAADTGGVDPLTADIVSDQVAAAQERWLGVTSTFRAPSRESFNTSSGKVAATRAIVAAAREADKSIKDQAMDAIKAAIKWLVNIVKQAFSKHERLLARASALAESAAKATANTEKISVKATVLNDVKPMAASAALLTLGNEYGKLNALVQTEEDVVIETKRLGGSAVVKFSEGKAKFEVATPETDTVIETALQPKEAETIAKNVYAALKVLKKHADAFSSENSTGVTAIMKAVVKPGEGNDRTTAISKARALTGVAAFLTRTGYSVAATLLELVAASTKPAKAK